MTVETTPIRNPVAAKPLDDEPIALFFVPPDHSARFRAILSHLRQIHAPDSAEEAHIVDRLALAQAALYDAAAAHDDHRRWLRDHAAELFERHHQERFEADLRNWRASPATMTETFGKTWHSARFLRDLWHAARDGTTDGLGLSFDQVRDMVTALGGDWRADRIDIHRGRLFTLFLATFPEPGPAIERWVTESRAGRHDISTREDDIDRAHWFAADAPGPDDARAELTRLADSQFQFWSAEAERLWALHRDERARCETGSPGQPLGTAADQRATRAILRELARAEQRVDQLERRLLALRRNRTKTGQRSAGSTVLVPALRTPADGPHLCPDARGPHTGEPLRVCSTETIENTFGNAQLIDLKSDAPTLRNGDRFESKPGSAPVDLSTEPVPARRNPRPDAQTVARACRRRMKPDLSRHEREKPARGGRTSGPTDRPAEA